QSPGLSHTGESVVVELNAARFTLFGGDDDNSIGPTSTVNGCGRGILQYIYRLHIHGIDTIDIPNETVNDYQRTVVAIGADATNQNDRCCARLSGRRSDVHAADLALQCLIYPLHIDVLQLFSCHTGN